jgi:COP9 signalosome complex subunit 2
MTTTALVAVYERILDRLSSFGPSLNRLWFTTATKLARIYIESNNEYTQQIKDLLEKMASACKLPDGVTDDITGKGSQLLELYALEIQLLNQTTSGENLNKVKNILVKCNQANSAVSNPRSMAIIREYAGKQFMDQKRFDDAYNELWESFKAYSDVGTPRARILLKYVVLANMFSLSKINPFDSREARAYQDDIEVAMMLQFRLAYEKRNVADIDSILSDQRFIEASDPFIQSHLECLLYTIKLELLENVCKAYQRVDLGKLGARIDVQRNELVRMVIKLVNDGRLNGLIDNDQLVTFENLPVSSQLTEVEAIADVLEKLDSELLTFHNKWQESTSTVSRALDR